MKTNPTNPLFGSVTALVVLVICALGCTSLGGSTTKKPDSTANSSSAQKSATPPADIAGEYNVVGTNENGSPYRGGLAIIKHGDVLQFRWNAGKQYDGVGVRNGDVVAVAFTGGASGKGCGVVSYQILGDGTLDGVWGYWGLNESGTEKAERTSGSGVEGDYNTTGKNPNGNSYTGKLTVASKASGYTFSWSNNTSGFGVRQGNTLSVGLGGSHCAFVAYEIKPDGTLDGIWGGYGTDKTGTEKATKK
jgi:hypothetical protein